MCVTVCVRENECEGDSRENARGRTSGSKREQVSRGKPRERDRVSVIERETESEC